MRPESVESTNINKVIASVAGLLSISCITCMAVINYYYPYKRLDDTLLEYPQYINALDSSVMLGLPVLLLIVLLNAGLELFNKFTFSKLLLNLAALGIVIGALLYCSKLFLEGYD